MITKVKLIIGAIIVLSVIVSIVCVYIYINALNDKIVDLNITISNQENEIGNLNSYIETLNGNIDMLQKDVAAFKEAIEVTSEYVNTVEQVHSDEDVIKQQIYEEVLVNDEARDWFNEKLPDDLLSIIHQRAADGMCNN